MSKVRRGKKSKKKNNHHPHTNKYANKIGRKKKEDLPN